MKFWKTRSSLQPVVTVMPADTAAVADAALVECPLNIGTFTPDFSRAILRWGNRFMWFYYGQKESLLTVGRPGQACSLSYALTGHMMGFWSNFGKKNSVLLVCLALQERLVGNTLR